MLRRIASFAFLFVAPLAAQVTVIPPVTSHALPTPVMNVEPLLGSHVTYDVESLLQQSRAYVDMAREYTTYSLSSAFDHFEPSYTISANYSSDFSGFNSGPRAPWAKNDPADSLYRSARDLLNRGDYRRSAVMFKELPQKFPASVYVNDAMYWQAFSLYRSGSTAELQEALAVLEVLKSKTPATEASNRNRESTVDAFQANRDKAAADRGKAAAEVGKANADAARNNAATKASASDNRYITNTYDANRLTYSMPALFGRGQNDAAQLALRIARVLTERGLGNDAAVKRALAAAGDACDSEDQQVRGEALSALMQSDPEVARQSAVRTLAKRDDCSASLRRSALSLIATKKDEASAAILIPVAKSDPNVDVRSTAVDYLARMPGDAALNTLQDLAANNDNDRVQRAAIRALSSSPNARAKSGLRALIEKNDANESLRMTALESYGRESSPDDIAWLRGAYGKVTSPRVKEAIVSAVGRIGGDANDSWLSSLVRNEDEPMEARMSALRTAGRAMDITALGKLYDATSQRPMRSTLIDMLANRKEPAAIDKLIDIAKTGTDPGLRRSAISALARSKDARAQKMLLDMVDHL